MNQSITEGTVIGWDLKGNIWSFSGTLLLTYFNLLFNKIKVLCITVSLYMYYHEIIHDFIGYVIKYHNSHEFKIIYYKVSSTDGGFKVHCLLLSRSQSSIKF